MMRLGQHESAFTVTLEAMGAPGQFIASGPDGALVLAQVGGGARVLGVGEGEGEMRRGGRGKGKCQGPGDRSCLFTTLPQVPPLPCLLPSK